jgi:D-alanine-D-alanine ligase
VERQKPQDPIKNSAKTSSTAKKTKLTPVRTLGPVSDLERHLPPEWWKDIFNSLYLKTDGDVVENDLNTVRDIDWVIKTTGIQPTDHILDMCCGQGRHSLELSGRGYLNVSGLDR